MRRPLSLALLAAGALLAIGLILSNQRLLATGLIVLIVLPLVNMMLAAAAEFRRRAWPFAFIACVVLALLLWNVHKVIPTSP